MMKKEGDISKDREKYQKELDIQPTRPYVFLVHP